MRKHCRCAREPGTYNVSDGLGQDDVTCADCGLPLPPTYKQTDPAMREARSVVNRVLDLFNDALPAQQIEGFTEARQATNDPADQYVALVLDEYRSAPETCEMVYEEPMDFAQCLTHDETFPLGEECRFNGKVMWEVFAEEADRQRQRAVMAEMSLSLSLIHI